MTTIFDYPDFIQQEFEDLYFTDEENAWLDRTHVNITDLDSQPYLTVDCLQS